MASSRFNTRGLIAARSRLGTNPRRSSDVRFQLEGRAGLRPQEAYGTRSRQGRGGGCHDRLLGTRQTSPYHCHPDATEIYFCFEGGGSMRTPTERPELAPGVCVVPPRGTL